MSSQWRKDPRVVAAVEEIRQQYSSVIWAGITVRLHDRTDDPLIYTCALCREAYQHWLVSNRLWKALPPHLHKRKLCFPCFLTIRTSEKLRKIHEQQK